MTAITAYRDPKHRKRIAVLRAADPAQALRRLAEWNTIMDRVGDAESPERGREHRREADELWVNMKKEQPWTFLGWLGADTKTVVDEGGVDIGVAAPGDLHEAEDKLEGWR